MGKSPTYLRTDHHSGRQTFPSAFLGQGRRSLGRGQEPPVCPHSVCDSDPRWPVTISRPWMAIRAWRAQLWTQGPGPATGPASTQRGAGDPHRRHLPLSAPPQPGLPRNEHTSAPPIWKALRLNGSISSAIITNPSGNVSSKMKSLCQNFH